MSNRTLLIGIGSRLCKDQWWIDKILDDHSHLPSDFASGGAVGADSMCERWARRHGIKCRIFKADWLKFGRSAGFRRSAKLVAWARSEFKPECVRVVAVYEGNKRSLGTAFTVRLCREAGFKVVEVFDSGVDTSI